MKRIVDNMSRLSVQEFSAVMAVNTDIDRIDTDSYTVVFWYRDCRYVAQKTADGVQVRS